MERFAVIGLGHFGGEVARKLFAEGKEIIAVDGDKEKVQVAAEYSSQAICADVTDKRTLESLGINEVDAAIVSLGERMDVITLAALHLKELGVPYLIVKAISKDHEKILRAIGVNEVIHPEEFAARSLANRLSLFGVSEFLPILPNYSVVLLKTPKCFFERKISEVENNEVQIVAIQRQNKVFLVPKDDEILQGGDTMILLGENKHLSKFAERIENE